MSRSRRSRFALHVFIIAVLAALGAALTGVRTANCSQEETLAQTGRNPLVNLSLAELGNVRVTTYSKEPEEVWQTPAAIYVLTQEDIRRSGATSIPELLRLVPGVEVAQIDSDHWAVGIRGFGSQFSKYVLVMIDGRSVYTPLFAGVYWEVQNVPLKDIDRIEVIRGPGGAIWGPNAVNGVINIITKGAQETHGFQASAAGGNADQGRAEARYGAGNGKTFDYRVYGMGFRRSAGHHPGFANFDDWQTGQGGFRMDWRPQRRDALTLEGDIYRGADGVRVGIGQYLPPAQLNVDGTEHVSGGNLLAHWTRRFDRGSDIQVRGYYDRTYRLGPQYGERRNTFDADFIHHLTLWRNQDFTWGVGARLSPSDFIQVIPTADFLPHHQDDTLYTAFARDRIPLVEDQLWLTLGSKFEDNNFSGFGLEPSARILWRPRPHQSLWAAVTRALRTPARLDEDLMLTGTLQANPPTFLRILGNTNLRPEVLTSFEAGYRTMPARNVYLDIAAFHGHYNDLSAFGGASIFSELTPSPAHTVIAVPYVNGVRATTNGFEISPDWQPLSWWSLRGSYSYLHLNAFNKPGLQETGSVASYEGSSPHHEVVIESRFNLPKGFEFDPTYRYVSALPAQMAPAYQTADARLGWRLNRRLSISLVGQNLFQPYHVEFSGDPGLLVGIKRSGYLELTWNP
ncbi:MAG TPA: TonB-dependent receptor [Terriglobia bacterium]|nr:TonB-dependent receptor [Terriglobia bacterium]